jgi:hypothetical protein
MAYGKMKETKELIQGCQQKDYFGTTVNIASRMESKVAQKDGIAFYTPTKLNSQIAKIPNLEKVLILPKCKTKLPKTIKCIRSNKIKGIDELIVYRFKMT